MLPEQRTRPVEYVALLLGGQPSYSRHLSRRAAVDVSQDHNLAPRIGQRCQRGLECLRLHRRMVGRPRARKLLPMIGVRFAVPLEAVGIDSRCGREPPAPPRKAVPECAASGGEVGDHSRNRDLHRLAASAVRAGAVSVNQPSLVSMTRSTVTFSVTASFLMLIPPLSYLTLQEGRNHR